MQAICPNCNSNQISLKMDLEVQAVFEDGAIQLVAPDEVHDQGQLSCDDCGATDNHGPRSLGTTHPQYPRRVWLAAAARHYDRLAIR